MLRFYSILSVSARRILIGALALMMVSLFAVMPQQAAAQSGDSTSDMTVEANNSIYTELGGSALLYSLNYDYRFNRDWSARIGAMTAGPFTIIPLTGSYLYGTNHNLELGLGGMYLNVSSGGDTAGIDDDASTVTGTAILGYRYQSTDGGIIFRASITPVYVGNVGILPWGGLSVGYNF